MQSRLVLSSSSVAKRPAGRRSAKVLPNVNGYAAVIRAREKSNNNSRHMVSGQLLNKCIRNRVRQATPQQPVPARCSSIGGRRSTSCSSSAKQKSAWSVDCTTAGWSYSTAISACGNFERKVSPQASWHDAGYSVRDALVAAGC